MRVKDDATVAIQVAAPPGVVRVPVVVGAKSAFDADRALTRVGLNLARDIGDRVDTSARTGTVVTQVPKAGEIVQKGSEVAIETAVRGR